MRLNIRSNNSINRGIWVVIIRLLMVACETERATTSLDADEIPASHAHLARTCQIGWLFHREVAREVAQILREQLPTTQQYLAIKTGNEEGIYTFDFLGFNDNKAVYLSANPIVLEVKVYEGLTVPELSSAFLDLIEGDRKRLASYFGSGQVNPDLLHQQGGITGNFLRIANGHQIQDLALLDLREIRFGSQPIHHEGVAIFMEWLDFLEHQLPKPAKFWQEDLLSAPHSTFSSPSPPEIQAFLNRLTQNRFPELNEVKAIAKPISLQGS